MMNLQISTKEHGSINVSKSVNGTTDASCGTCYTCACDENNIKTKKVDHYHSYSVSDTSRSFHIHCHYLGPRSWLRFWLIPFATFQMILGTDILASTFLEHDSKYLKCYIRSYSISLDEHFEADDRCGGPRVALLRVFAETTTPRSKWLCMSIARCMPLSIDYSALIAAITSEF